MKYIIYLHGFRSTSLNSIRVEKLDAYFPECEVIGLTYAPHNPWSAIRSINDAIHTLGWENICGVIGTSLGGFWARWIASNYDIEAIAINPSMNPGKTLPVGSFPVYGAEHLNIVVTEEDLKDFDDVTIDASNMLYVLAMDDELLDARATLDSIHPSDRVWTEDTGGHRFENMDHLKNMFRENFGLSIQDN